MARVDEKAVLDFKKRLGKKGMIVIIGLIAGILLLIIPSPKSEEVTIKEEGNMTSAEYCSVLEQKAERLICSLSGVDDCEVFITLGSGFCYTYASDMKLIDNANGKTTEKTLVLAGNGNGENAVLIEETMPSVAGVAVVCKGASYETQYRIIELMCALFDIKSNRISVQT